MKRTLIAFLLLVLAVIVFVYPGNKEGIASNKKEAVKENKTGNDVQKKSKAPEFKLKSVDGKDVKLSDFKGKIVIIDFWATWCGPCRNGVPDLVSLQKEYKGKLVVLGVSLDRLSGTDKDVKNFIKELKINYTIVFGDEKVAMDYGNIQAIPTSFIVDQQGNIVDKHIGLVPKSAYTDKIKSLLSQS